MCDSNLFNIIHSYYPINAFSPDLTLLVEWQGWHQSHKNPTPRIPKDSLLEQVEKEN